MNPLHVVLNGCYYDAFIDGSKKYELRLGSNPKFSPQKVYSGRELTLQRGYTKTQARGVVGTVITGTIDEILEKVEFKLIDPSATTKHGLAVDVLKLLHCTEVNSPLVAFEVLLEARQPLE